MRLENRFSKCIFISDMENANVKLLTAPYRKSTSHFNINEKRLPHKHQLTALKNNLHLVAETMYAQFTVC